MNASKTAASAALVLLLGAAASCGGAKENAPSRPASEPATQTPVPPGAPPATPAPGTVSAPPSTGSASISGKVTFTGTVPPAEQVKLGSDAYCAKANRAGMAREELVVAPDKGLANVFVWVKEGIAGRYPAPSTPVVLDQKGCSYHPHVFGVMVGQSVDVLNSDDTTHNVHAVASSNSSFNVGMPVPGQKISRTFTKPEVMVKFKCDVHGWMSAWCGVVPHPFFAVTGSDGAFAIRELPPGTYTIEAWHEKLGTRTQKLTVGAGETKNLSFAFDAPA